MISRTAWYATRGGRARARREPEASLKHFFVMILAVLTSGAILAPAASAYAYYYESLPADTPAEAIPGCIACHGTLSPTEADTGGSHGGYATTTSKCATCHSVHQASAAGVQLLPGATVKATCETCHDGTGGAGVYGVLEEGQVRSGHSVETTSLVPGGDASTGTSATAQFSGLGGLLTCSDCHSPHGTDVVAAFVGDRDRRSGPSASKATVVASSRLLKRRPTTATQTVDVYGSDWCGACHQGRLAGSGAQGNHPVESTITASGASDVVSRYWYGNVVRVAGFDTTTTELGSLGRNNFGYVMPSPRSELQAGHFPICQQCHEDSRTVGDEAPRQVAPGEVFTATNPAVGSFPHESSNERLLVEPTDRLCLNCHLPK